MQIRNIHSTDIPILRDIWYNHFKDEFDFPDFLNGYLSNFIVTDETNNIVVAGGLKMQAEIVLLTDMDKPLEDRYIALNEALGISTYTASKLNLDSIHVFIQNEKWKSRLIKSGFKPTKGQALVLGV